MVFYVLFDCLAANSGPFLSGKSYSTNTNHCNHCIFTITVRLVMRLGCWVAKPDRVFNGR